MSSNLNIEQIPISNCKCGKEPNLKMSKSLLLIHVECACGKKGEDSCSSREAILDWNGKQKS